MRAGADAAEICKAPATAPALRYRLLVPLLIGACGAAAASAPASRAEQAGTLDAPAFPPGPQSRTLYLKLIANMRESGKAHAALAHLDAFDKQYPRRPEAALLRGNCLVDVEDYPGAAAIYRQLLRGSEAAAAYAGLGRIGALGGNWPEAAAEFAHAVELSPVSAEYLNDYGFALVRAGRAGDGLFRLRQAAELSPGNAKVRNNMIIALGATGNDAEARRMLAAIPTAEERGAVEAAMLAARPPASP